MFPVKIRKFDSKTDLNFVTSSWIKYLSSRVKDMNSYWFSAAQHALIQQILNNKAYCYVACSPDDPEHIYGYVVAEDIETPRKPFQILHWAYVKSGFRRSGVFSKLMSFVTDEGSTVFYTIKLHHPSSKYKFTYCPKLLTATGIKKVKLLRELGERYGQTSERVFNEEPNPSVGLETGTTEDL